MAFAKRIQPVTEKVAIQKTVFAVAWPIAQTAYQIYRASHESPPGRETWRKTGIAISKAFDVAEPLHDETSIRRTGSA